MARPKGITAVATATKKSGIDIARVTQEASRNFVAPKPLASNESVRAQIVHDTPAARPPKRVCTIQKVGGFTFFTTEEDRAALDFIAFRNKFEKQNVVRAALHQFLQQHYRDGVGLDEAAQALVNGYEDSIYRWE